MRERIEYEPDGVDFGWVMQVTFVLTITGGSLVVALLSLVVADLPTWTDRALFAVRVGAVIWILTAIPVYLYARRRATSDEEDSEGEAPEPDVQT